MCFPFFIFRSRGRQHNEQRGDQESDHNGEQGGLQVVEQGGLQVVEQGSQQVVEQGGLHVVEQGSQQVGEQAGLQVSGHDGEPHSHIIITGAQGGTTPAPNRLEINDLIKNTKQFSLYIQALTIMSETRQTDPLSHFSIGGIHGLPFLPWEGAGGSRIAQGTQWLGYCTHGNVLFPTWHRPYVALYEQVLQQHALDVAQLYRSDQQLWLHAAENLYWDWATDSIPPPEVISLENVIITTPDGTKSMLNPLIRYSFNPVDSSFPTSWRHLNTTIRSPAPNAPTVTNVQLLIESLLSIQRNLTLSTYGMFTHAHTWAKFSNHSSGMDGITLESLHDRVHVAIGGHMRNAEVSAFDPIFFLHHANVDSAQRSALIDTHHSPTARSMIPST